MDVLSDYISINPAGPADLAEDWMFIVHTPPCRPGDIGCCRQMAMRMGMGGVVTLSDSSAGDPFYSFSEHMITDDEIVFRVGPPGQSSASEIDKQRNIHEQH